MAIEDSAVVPQAKKTEVDEASDVARIQLPATGSNSSDSENFTDLVLAVAVASCGTASHFDGI